MKNCFHCGLASTNQYDTIIRGENRHFCCIGCQAIAQAIDSGGLSDFYQYRDSLNNTASVKTTPFDAYNLDEVQADFVTLLDANKRLAKLNVIGISCAACAWLIENYLAKIEGVLNVQVNVSSRRAHIEWNNSLVKLSKIMESLESIGYQPQPAIASIQDEIQKKEQKELLLRLGLAGIGMMQVGMVAIALYAGDIQGISDHWQFLLRCVSWVIATPVLLYSANPFFISAFRALRLRHLSMDVPIALALSIAYFASGYATITRSGDVYFDSISMLTFFLLLGRYIEAKARHSSAFTFSNLSQLLPLSVELFDGKNKKRVPLKKIQVDDNVWVPSGEVFPFDGVIEEGRTTVDESVLTGESEQKQKQEGDTVLAGSTNGDTGIRLSVLAVAQNTLLAKIENLIENAASTKPKQQEWADKIAAYFVGIVLLIASIVAVGWYFIAPEKILWVLISVLVVTCPCALSLATPVALTVGTLKLRKMGMLVRSRFFLESLPNITNIVFDKTGTLTEGKLSVGEIRRISSQRFQLRDQDILDYIAALELNSSHPIANAFAKPEVVYQAVNVKVSPGLGIQGEINGRKFCFGKMEYSLSNSSLELSYPGEGLWQLLSVDNHPFAWVLLKDTPRKNLHSALKHIADQKLEVEVLSGDRKENVRDFCREYSIESFSGELLPGDKLDRIRYLQKQGRHILMVGDGINDVPVLSGADLSVAIAGSTQLAESKADCVLMNGDLSTLAKAMAFSKMVKRTIRQNFIWAVGYNVIALPAAITGILPPYIAAIGMSLSSLIVVLNALRLNR